MLSTPCPTCGRLKNPNARQCKPCADEARRQALLGRKYDEGRIERSKQGLQRKRDQGWSGFDLGSFTRGKPSPKAKPVGYTRISNGHTQIKCEDGKFRYRARVVWAATNGAIPKGRLIHHRNEDPHDDRLENLQMVTRSEHNAIHATPERMRARQLLGVAARKRNHTY